MITQLEHTDPDIARKLRAVFQASYAIEAELLKATDFPPLKRPLEDYQNSENVFFGFFKADELAGAIEIDQGIDSVHIQSLVVDPKFFRQGIAGKLVRHVLETFDTKLFTVETGLDNRPAIALYEKLGFREVDQYDTDHGVRKGRFALHMQHDSGSPLT